jgi:dTDP-4-amino-4,6-dideoxygalactose transaminase
MVSLGRRTGSVSRSEYAKFTGARHCIGVANGLEALHLSLRAMGIVAGDEIIVPSNTFIATLLAASEAGAVPKFVEPDPTTHNIDPGLIEAAITSRTKADYSGASLWATSGHGAQSWRLQTDADCGY